MAPKSAKGIAQQFKRAIFPPEGVRPAWEAIDHLAKALGKNLGLNSLADVRAGLPAPKPMQNLVPEARV